LIKYIKIPEHCFKRANERSILNDVVFYYELKVLSDNGFFMKGSVAKLISKKLKCTENTVWKKLKRLVNLGLCNKNTNGYSLKSYDTLFSTLGYNLEKDGHRKGSFKINKIPHTRGMKIKHQLALVDIRDNLNNQTHKAFYNLHQDKRYQYTENNLHCATMKDKREILESLAKDNVRMMALNDEAIETNTFMEAMSKDYNIKYCNPDITLSLKGVCQILGFTNTSSAFVLLKQMQENNLIEISRRLIRIGSTTMSYKEFIKDYSRTHILRDGTLFRRLCNKVVVVG
jgi:hypothetical protein